MRHHHFGECLFHECRSVNPVIPAMTTTCRRTATLLFLVHTLVVRRLESVCPVWRMAGWDLLCSCSSWQPVSSSLVTIVNFERVLPSITSRSSLLSYFLIGRRPQSSITRRSDFACLPMSLTKLHSAIAIARS